MISSRNDGLMLHFLLASLRAIVEMLLLCMLGQGFLHVLAGSARDRNLVYRLFATITHPVLQLIRRLLPPAVSGGPVATVAFVSLLLLWLGLAILKKSI